jgi:hypothetical protein
MQDLWTNKLLIRREATHGGLQAATVVRPRLTAAIVNRLRAGVQSRQDPYGTKEFQDVVHQGWDIEMRGEVTSGEFLVWLLSQVSSAGTPERAMQAWELREESSVPTFAIQIQELDGTDHTYQAAALRSLRFTIKGRTILGWLAKFQACTLDRTAPGWSATHVDTGDIMAAPDASIGLEAILTPGSAPEAITGFDVSLDINHEGAALARFSPDGYATAHQGGTWDIAGQILIPETPGITEESFESTFPGDLAVWWSGGSGNRMEIQAGITLAAEQRLAISQEWRQVACAFVSRRGPENPVAKFFHQGGIFS